MEPRSSSSRGVPACQFLRVRPGAFRRSRVVQPAHLQKRHGRRNSNLERVRPAACRLRLPAGASRRLPVIRRSPGEVLHVPRDQRRCGRQGRARPGGHLGVLALGPHQRSPKTRNGSMSPHFRATAGPYGPTALPGATIGLAQTVADLELPVSSVLSPESRTVNVKLVVPDPPGVFTSSLMSRDSISLTTTAVLFGQVFSP